MYRGKVINKVRGMRLRNEWHSPPNTCLKVTSPLQWLCQTLLLFLPSPFLSEQYPTLLSLSHRFLLFSHLHGPHFPSLRRCRHGRCPAPSHVRRRVRSSPSSFVFQLLMCLILLIRVFCGFVLRVCLFVDWLINRLISGCWEWKCACVCVSFFCYSAFSVVSVSRAEVVKVLIVWLFCIRCLIMA